MSKSACPRTAGSVVRNLMLASWLAAGTLAPAAAEPACPRERILEVDLDALRQQLLAAPEDEAVQRAGLARLHLLPPDDAPSYEPTWGGRLRLFDVFEVDLTAASEPDRVVQLVYVEDATIHQRIGVLAPLGPGSFCAVDASLSASSHQRFWSAAPEHRYPRTLAFVPLVDETQQALSVVDEWGRSSGAQAGAEHHLSYWIADGLALREVFSTNTLSRGGGYGGVESRVDLRGGFPRTIVVSRAAVQGSLDGPAPREDLPRVEVHTWSGSEYRQQQREPTDFQCPADQVLELDLDALRGTMLAATTDAEAQRAGLAQLRLSAEFLGDLEQGWVGTLEAFDRFPAPLVEPLIEDLVVQLRYENDLFEYLRIQVLHPLGTDRWCALGDDLSHDQSHDEIPCLGGEHGRPRTLGFEYVTDAARQVIWVADEGGWCQGVGRASRLSYALWEVQGARLVQIFSAPTLELSYRSPIPPMEVLEGEVVLNGDFPQSLDYTRRRTCDPGELLETDPCMPFSCTPEHVHFGYLYGGDIYRVEGESARPAEPSMTVVTEGDRRVFYGADGKKIAEGSCAEGGEWWFYDEAGQRGQFRNYQGGRLR